MVKYCVICKYRFKIGDQRSFHRIPSNMERRKDWLGRILSYLGNENIPKDSVVCSHHFSSDDFLRKPSGKIALKGTALPQISSSSQQAADISAADSSIIPFEESEQDTVNASVDDPNGKLAEPPQKKLKYQLSSNVTDKSDHQFLSPCLPCTSSEKMSPRKDTDSDVSSRTVTANSPEQDRSSRTLTATSPSTRSTLGSSESGNMKSTSSSSIEKVTRIAASPINMEEQMEDSDIFEEIQSQLKMELPMYLKNLLIFNGFDNEILLKDITETDIKNLETYAQTQLLHRIPKDEYKNYFGPLYWKQPNKFQIVLGHKKIIHIIRDYCKNKHKTTSDKCTMTEQFEEVNIPPESRDRSINMSEIKTEYPPSLESQDLSIDPSEIKIEYPLLLESQELGIDPVQIKTEYPSSMESQERIIDPSEIKPEYPSSLES